MLGVMVLTVKWFLCAWTVGVLQNQDRNIPLLITLTTSDGQSFTACYLDRWDYMMALAELLFLCWGGSLSRAVKAVPSAFHEPRYMGIAIHNELLFCTVFHLLRFMKLNLHPDWMLLLFFIHVHVTNTITLGLLFFPKFIHISQLIKEDTASEMYEDEVDLRRSCLQLNNSFTSTCWSDHNLDPDDIRGELKKLYAQVEVYKTKKMENNNPHLRKKHSSRLLFGRSIIKRISEIPDSMSRQGSHKDGDPPTAGGSGKFSGSRLKNSESTIMKNETTKSPLPEIEKCAPVRDASLQNCMNKRTSLTESIDKAPLFCKSLSAQNLALDNNFLQPVSTRVQKSLSLTENNKDNYSVSPQNMANTSHAFTMNTNFNSFDEAMVKRESHTSSKTSIKKQATSVPTEQDALTITLQTNPSTSPSTFLHVCPWEYGSTLPSSSPPVEKTEHNLDSDVETSRPKPPVSSSAPGSPYSFAKPMVRCAFSFHSTTQSLLLARGLAAKKSSVKNSKEKDKGASELTKSMTLNSATMSKKKTLETPIRSMTCVHSKSCLVKPPLIHRYESEDMDYENIVQFQNSGKQGHCLTPSTDSTKASHHQDSLIVPRSIVCPWDAPKKTCQQSSIADVCPWEEQQQHQLHTKAFSDNDDPTWETERKQMHITLADKCFYPWESKGKGSRNIYSSKKETEQHQIHTGATVLPYTVKQDFTKKVSEETKLTERVIYVNPCPDTKKHSLVPQETLQNDVCPWETSDTHTNHEMMSVCVYPWKTSGTPGKCSETIRSTDSLTQTISKQLTITGVMDICQWDQDHPEQFSCQRELEKVPKTDAEQQKNIDKKTLSMPYPPNKQVTSTAETCPWDFPESPLIPKEVYLLETENATLQPKQEDEGLPSQASATKKRDSCSKEAEATDQSEGITITKEADTLILQKESVPAKICLWGNSALDSEQPKNSINEKKEENTSTTQGARASRPLTRSDALCPWEMNEGTQTSISDHDNNSDIFTWEEPIAEESDAETAAEAFGFPPDL